MPQKGISPSQAGTTVYSTDPVVPSVLLSSQIHAATRLLHTRLNRLITARLPLCLPPYAESPLVYLAGLRRFARIYYTFEDALRSIGWKGGIEHDNEGFSDGDSREHTRRPKTGTKNALQALYLPQLARSQRLKSDIAFLEQRLCVDMLHRDISQHVSEETWDFDTHISQTISQKPCIILAYTWIMYMALFNGGRWMRSKLLDGGKQFWTGSDDSPEPSFLSFWFFEGDSDGDDVKEDFKARFLSVSETLTDDDRNDVIQEAVSIFENLILMVEELNDDCKRLDAMDSTTAHSTIEEKWVLPFRLVQHIQRLWSSGGTGLGVWIGNPVLATATTSDTR